MSPRRDTAAGRDRLSALPDDLLHLILRGLDARKAVCDLSLLSRLWRRLWASSPYVTLTHSSHFERFGSNLLLRRDPAAPVHVFCLHVTFCNSGHHAFQRRWLRDALVRDGLRVLELKLRRNTSHHFELPDCFFSCATLEEINLSASRREVISPEFVYLPRLKKLHLEDVLIKQKLNSGWPALEDLNLHQCCLGSFKISSETLKTLSITECTYTEIEVSAPNTASLKLTVSGRVHLYAMPSLVSAWVHVSYGAAGHLALSSSCAYDLVAALFNAQRIELFRFDLLLQDTVKMATTEGISFSNLKSLYVGEWLVTDFYNALAFFLQRAPNLVALTLDQWELYERHKRPSRGEVSRDNKPSAEVKLKVLSAPPINLEKLWIRLSKRDDIEEFRKMRSLLKEKTKPRDTEVVVF
ncbi:unnamed protein product [Urochloa humidicola]